MKIFPTKRPDCLFSETVYHKIKEDITEGKLYPGERVLVAKLAKEVGCSQAPIREALRQLGSEGVLSFERNKGCTVRKLSIPELDEIYGVLLLLERRGSSNKHREGQWRRHSAAKKSLQ